MSEDYDALIISKELFNGKNYGEFVNKTRR